MSTKFVPITLDDLKLSKEELTAIVEGAQKFLPPDPEDQDETLTIDESE